MDYKDAAAIAGGCGRPGADAAALATYYYTDLPAIAIIHFRIL